MVFFGKKEKEVKVGKGFVPIQRVLSMLEKGFSEIEIIDTLRKEGFSAEEIDKALTEAYKEVVNKQSIQTSQVQQPQLSQQPQVQQQTFQQNLPQIQPFQPVPLQEIKKESKESIERLPSKEEVISMEEYVEALIKEKIEEYNKKLMEISLKFKEVEDKISEINEKLMEIERKRKEELDKIFSETRSIKDLLNDLITKVEVLSNTIKEIIPSMLESIRLLSEIVQRQK